MSRFRSLQHAYDHFAMENELWATELDARKKQELFQQAVKTAAEAMYLKGCRKYPR